MPRYWIVIHRMFDQGWPFVYRAGTLILYVSIVVWGLSYFPHSESQIVPVLLAQSASLLTPDSRPPTPDSRLTAVENQIAAQHLANSFLGRMGRSIEPVVKPLGWDWRIGCAAIASFPAREVV